MTPEQQQQFNQELQLVIAVAAQIRGHYVTHDNAVLGAMELIQAAEKLLKGHYEPAKETPVQASAGVGAESDRVGQGGGEPSPAVPAGAPKPSRKVILDSISECSKVILAKKLRTQEQLVKMVEAFAVKRKEELNEGQALKLLEQLKEILQ
jgi:hypothetical protein